MENINIGSIYNYKSKEYMVKNIIAHKKRFLFWSWWASLVIYCSSYGKEYSRDIKEFKKRFYPGELPPLPNCRSSVYMAKETSTKGTTLSPGERIVPPLVSFDYAFKGAEKTSIIVSIPSGSNIDIEQIQKAIDNLNKGSRDPQDIIFTPKEEEEIKELHNKLSKES